MSLAVLVKHPDWADHDCGVWLDVKRESGEIMVRKGAAEWKPLGHWSPYVQEQITDRVRGVEWALTP